VTEENGSQDSRLEQLLTAQVLQQDAINGLFKIVEAHTVQLEELGSGPFEFLEDIGDG
jgi:hypothetical protein